MDLNLQSKVAIILASSKGLGKATALELAKEGVNVVIVARKNANLKNAVREIQNKTKSSVLSISADVKKAEDLENVVKKTIKEFGRIDILVNNAGGPPSGDFENVNDKMWQESFELNFMSVVRAARLVLPHMIKSGSGRIINILSTAVKQPIDNLILSNAIRAGVSGLAKSMSNEFAKYNITVNNVCPGPFLTDRVKQLHIGKTGLEKIIAAVPLNRMGKPEELAALITFLASDQASYITGTTIQIDGGVTKSIF